MIMHCKSKRDLNTGCTDLYTIFHHLTETAYHALLIILFFLFSKVVNIWMGHLESILKEMDAAVHTPPSALSLPGSSSPLDNVNALSKTYNNVIYVYVITHEYVT